MNTGGPVISGRSFIVGDRPRHARPGKWWRRWFRSAPPRTSAYDDLVPIKVPDPLPLPRLCVRPEEPFTFCPKHPFTPPGATRCGHCPPPPVLWFQAPAPTFDEVRAALERDLHGI